MPTNNEAVVDILDALSELSNKLGDLAVELRRDLLELERETHDVMDRVSALEDD